MSNRIRDPNSSGILREDNHKRAPSNKPQYVFSGQGIKKIWSKLQESCQILCRAIGLNILVSSFKFLRHPWGKGFEETTKIAIRKSQPVALLRALVHVIPVGVALWEVTLNWNTYYAGSYLLKQVYYQTAAKVHEIMIQASLAAVIFSYIRHQMVLGKGIPFGALFSGLQMNQISYLWSIEFWGSISSNYLSVWRKMIMLFLISVCFILAAVAGPSSAILLIPRLSYWPAGSTHFWLNATFNDIWPNRLNGSSVPRHCAIVEAGSPSNECPSSEWDFMQTWMSLTQNSIPWEFQNQNILLGSGESAPTATELTGKASTRQYKSIQDNPVIILDDGNNGSSFPIDAAISTTQQAVIADALTSISSIWFEAVGNTEIASHHGASFHDDQKVVHTIASNYYQPYSSTVCVRDTIQGSNDERNMTFPIASEFALNVNISAEFLSIMNASISGVPAMKAPSIRRAQLLELPGMESDNRVKWIELPQSPLTGVSVGLVVLLPRNPSDLSKKTTTAIRNNTDIVVCGIGAGWGASSINLTYFRSTNSATSSLINFDFSSQNFDLADIFPNPFQELTDVPVFFNPPMFPSIPVEIDVEWAEYLNPYVPSANTTVIDVLLKHDARNGSKAANPDVSVEDIITGLMTNGLARSGFTSELQGSIKFIEEKEDITRHRNSGNDTTEVPDGNLWVSGKSDIFAVDPEESKNWVKLRVDSTIQGYAYNIEGPAPKVAIAFLLTYCCFVLSHFVYSGISGIYSHPPL
ncbi:hypothetical protein MMC22_004911 [Lobaria immixta]|nr:hypothetical protein [Lobaria immixta]